MIYNWGIIKLIVWVLLSYYDYDDANGDNDSNNRYNNQRPFDLSFF